ncbi:hypothetical protein F750_0229 [Streptomyces sp. PAMC 26508]|nr:hypothetical protein F750_0229 [Streptomyces sp. PAMC 26508]
MPGDVLLLESVATTLTPRKCVVCGVQNPGCGPGRQCRLA